MGYAGFKIAVLAFQFGEPNQLCGFSGLFGLNTLGVHLNIETKKASFDRL